MKLVILPYDEKVHVGIPTVDKKSLEYATIVIDGDGWADKSDGLAITKSLNYLTNFQPSDAQAES